MEERLTIKQDRFVREYIKTGNGAHAARAAGYSEKCAREIAVENLSKPIIKRKIELEMSKEAEKLGITVEYVLSNIKRFAESENEKIAGTSLKANELLGKHLKIFHDTEVDVTVQHREVIRQLEELE